MLHVCFADLCEEPTSGTAGQPLENNSNWDAYLAVKLALKSVDRLHAVFNIDSAWTDSDGHTDPRPWWLRWNTDGDVSAHDNYPFPGLTVGTDAFGLASVRPINSIVEHRVCLLLVRDLVGVASRVGNAGYTIEEPRHSRDSLASSQCK